MCRISDSSSASNLNFCLLVWQLLIIDNQYCRKKKNTLNDYNAAGRFPRIRGVVIRPLIHSFIRPLIRPISILPIFFVSKKMPLPDFMRKKKNETDKRRSSVSSAIRSSVQLPLDDVPEEIIRDFHVSATPGDPTSTTTCEMFLTFWSLLSLRRCSHCCLCCRCSHCGRCCRCCRCYIDDLSLLFITFLLLLQQLMILILLLYLPSLLLLLLLLQQLAPIVLLLCLWFWL